jgi:CDP-diglyceride synthetase
MQTGRIKLVRGLVLCVLACVVAYFIVSPRSYFDGGAVRMLAVVLVLVISEFVISQTKRKKASNGTN